MDYTHICVWDGKGYIVATHQNNMSCSFTELRQILLRQQTTGNGLFVSQKKHIT